MCEISYNGNVIKDRGPLGRWLEKKYIAWISELGEVRPVEEFATYLGIKQPTFTRYYNGTRRRIDYQAALKIAEIVKDYEILDILGYQRPGPEQILAGYPPEFREQFMSALQSAREELDKRGITSGSDDAREIIIAAFRKFGLSISVMDGGGE